MNLLNKNFELPPWLSLGYFYHCFTGFFGNLMINVMIFCCFRSHYCEEVGLQHVGEEVTLAGWLQAVRWETFLLLYSFSLISRTVIFSNTGTYQILVCNNFIKKKLIPLCRFDFLMFLEKNCNKAFQCFYFWANIFLVISTKISMKSYAHWHLFRLYSIYIIETSQNIFQLWIILFVTVLRAKFFPAFSMFSFCK
jgi:hypothetical protein